MPDAKSLHYDAYPILQISQEAFMISVFGRWYRRKFSDPDAAMLLILILITTAALLLWGEHLSDVHALLKLFFEVELIWG